MAAMPEVTESVHYDVLHEPEMDHGAGGCRTASGRCRGDGLGLPESPPFLPSSRVRVLGDPGDASRNTGSMFSDVSQRSKTGLTAVYERKFVELGW